ncbi:MAG: excinuclease ABC subunit UvrA [Mycoplasmoidaceae bacterium]
MSKIINPVTHIIIKGARENNLKNINIDIPKNKLVVVTGLSGSGKSSLVFDTIFKEGKRRYIESLSTYARQFLGNNDKPNVDSIEGLSPSISIDQKSTSHNPRSTVGTITEIYDYLRLIYSKVGIPHCPNKHGEIKSIKNIDILNFIISNAVGKKVQIFAPIAKKEKGSFSTKLIQLKNDGFLRVRINKEIFTLDDEIIIDKNTKNDIDLLIDRIIVHDDELTKSRIFESIEKAIKEGNNFVIISIEGEEEKLFSTNFTCMKCHFSMPEIEPRLFSFNSPIGYCKTCKGLGITLEPDINKIIPDMNKSINDNGIEYFKNTKFSMSLDWQRFECLIKYYNINQNINISNLSDNELNIIKYGSDDAFDFTIISSGGTKYSKHEKIEGIFSLIKRRYYETNSELSRDFYSKYMTEMVCKKCSGKKLSDTALAILIDKKNITELCDMSIKNLILFFLEMNLPLNKLNIISLAIDEINSRLFFLKNIGLEYLSLSRNANTLSGGESQRIRLASQIGSSLTGVLYVLDEPTIGLHQKDNMHLINTIKNIRDLGNTVIVVEHDEETMQNADWIIDIGPEAGDNGGYVVNEGIYEDFIRNENSITANYLSGRKKIYLPEKRRSGNGKYLILENAIGNNLKNVTLKIPLGKLIAVTGVSGSGKSTLINETLVKAIEKEILNPFIEPLPYKKINGVEHIDKIIKISQAPIGRTPRSNPATYISLFDDIRELFASTIQSKERGFSKGRFSFNIKGGRCESCSGDGIIKIQMHFLPDVYVKCETCNGKKYNFDTLSIKYKKKNIYDILEMNVDSALQFFNNIPQIKRKLQLLKDVGLGYIKLGEQATFLSGGEAQRIKIAKHLQRKPTGKTIYFLDEPTTGLHIEDINKLINIFNRIVNNGDTVVIIEHNLDLIKVCDYIIDIGPNGGDDGGRILFEGPPEKIINAKNSYTGEYLIKKIIV